MVSTRPSLSMRTPDPSRSRPKVATVRPSGSMEDLKVCIADRDGKRLNQAADALAAIAPSGGADVLAVATDVGDRASVRQLHETVRARFGPVHVLMNNAGVQPGSAMFGPEANWTEFPFAWRTQLDETVMVVRPA